jgi:PAS domain S-box-containing protein
MKKPSNPQSQQNYPTFSTTYKWKALLFLIVGLLLTTLSTYYTAHEIEIQKNYDFSIVCNEIKTKIETRLYSHAQFLRSTSAYVTASDSVTRNEWKDFYDRAKVIKNLPEIQGVSYVILIAKNQIKKHIESIKRQGFQNYTIRPIGDRAIYSSIIYIEPFLGKNLRTLGYDMLTEPIRRKAMELSRDSNVAMLSGKVILIQETNIDIQAGTVMYVPVYKKEMPINTVEQRRAALKGWVSIPYRMNNLMHGILGHWDLNKQERIHLQIFDERISTQSKLFDSQINDSSKQHYSNSRTCIEPFEFNGKKWIIKLSQSNETFAYFQSNVLIVLICGVIISILLFSLFIALFNTRFKAQQIAEKLAADVKESEANFKLLFNFNPDVVTIVRASDNKIITVNDSFVSRLGYSRNETIGKTTMEINIWCNPAERQELVNDIMKNGYSNNFEALFCHKNGMTYTGILSAKIIQLYGEPHILSVTRDITERKQIEKELNENEEKYRLLFETITEGIALNEMIFDEKGEMINYRIVEVNQAFYATGDYGSKAVINNVATDLYGMSNEQITTFWKSHQEKKTTEYSEILNPLNNKWFYISTSPFINGKFVTVFVDITERKRTEKFLIEIQNNLSRTLREQSIILDNAPIGIAKIINSKQLWVNKEMEKMFGYSKEELIGEAIHVLYPNDEMYTKMGTDVYPEITTGESFEATQEFICRNGRKKTIRIIGKAVDTADLSKGTICLLEDVTEQKKAELTIQNQTQELIKLNADKDRFISILAHDLKSPFNSILGFLDLLSNNMQEYDSTTILRYINIINNSAIRTYHLLEDTLLWANAQSGKLPFEPEKQSFKTICKNVIDSLSLSARNKNIKVNYFVADELLVYADRHMLNTIIRNLVSNAIKFTNDNGRIDIYGLQKDSTFTITVCDNGVGIDPLLLTKLFNFSEIISTNGTANEKGTGLGLLLCKEFVEKHGGKIWVESRLNNGSSFYFTLPIYTETTNNATE